MTNAESRGADVEQFFRLMSLHNYWLNADFLRDVFMKRVRDVSSPHERGFAATMDNTIAMSLWYATMYVVIEGWREARLSDHDVDTLLAQEGHVEHLRVFRNQVFHYQKAYDNPKLLQFLGTSDDDAGAVTTWAKSMHRALGKAIEAAIQANLDRDRRAGQT